MNKHRDFQKFYKFPSATFWRLSFKFIVMATGVYQDAFPFACFRKEIWCCGFSCRVLLMGRLRFSRDAVELDSFGENNFRPWQRKGKRISKAALCCESLWYGFLFSAIMEHDDLICCEWMRRKSFPFTTPARPPDSSSPHISCFLPNDANGTKQAVQVFKSNKLRPSGIVSGYKRNSQHDLSFFLRRLRPSGSLYLMSLTSVTVGKLTRVVVNMSQYPWNVLRNVCINTRQAWISTHNSPWHDAADKPSVSLVGIGTQQRTARVALNEWEIKVSVKFVSSTDRVIRNHVQGCETRRRSPPAARHDNMRAGTVINIFRLSDGHVNGGSVVCTRLACVKSSGLQESRWDLNQVSEK